MSTNDELLFDLEIPGGQQTGTGTQRVSGHVVRHSVDLAIKEPTELVLGTDKVHKDDFEILHLVGQGAYGKVRSFFFFFFFLSAAAAARSSIFPAFRSQGFAFLCPEWN
jgi:hypothetical protein